LPRRFELDGMRSPPADDGWYDPPSPAGPRKLRSSMGGLLGGPTCWASTPPSPLRWRFREQLSAFLPPQKPGSSLHSRRVRPTPNTQVSTSALVWVYCLPVALPTNPMGFSELPEEPLFSFFCFSPFPPLKLRNVDQSAHDRLPPPMCRTRRMGLPSPFF